MAAISNLNPTLLDLKKTLDPDGGVADVIEILAQTNEALEDLTYIEANDRTSHRTTVRTGYPEPTWRRLYQSVQPNKGTTAQVTDTLGNMEAYGEVDADLVKMAKDPMKFRMIEDRAHIEGMNNELMSTLFYGNEGTAPAEFTGLAPRYNSLSAANSDNVISAGGAGSDNTSIWLCVWGPNTGHMIYPSGFQAGMSVRDLGEVTKESSDGLMQVYRSHYKMAAGLTIRDWRYFVRIANIDVSDLSSSTTAQKALITNMIKATERIPAFGIGRAAWYVNRPVREALRLGILEKVSSNLTWESVEGKRVMTFDGIPVRRCDALLNTESVVS